MSTPTPPFSCQREIEQPNFVATQARDQDTVILGNHPFFPNIALLDFQERYGMDAGAGIEAKQIQALQVAISKINHELIMGNPSWLDQQQARDFNYLNEIDLKSAGSCQNPQFLYFTAVYAEAKAYLIESEINHDSQKRELDFIERMTVKVADYRTQSLDALNMLLGLNLNFRGYVV